MSRAEPEHEPVLLEPVLRLLDPQPGQVCLDGTVGLGGHALAIAPRLAPGGCYVGLDVDEEMLTTARTRLSSLSGISIRLTRGNYAEFPAALSGAGVEAADLMLLDLGVNSAQLDDPTRGLSFDRDGPLDMRMDRGQTLTAADLVNRSSERELSDLFFEYGQEPAARKIAKEVCARRRDRRITTTRVLAQAVEAVYGGAGRPGRTHPATRVFQALRIAVNEELKSLTAFMGKAMGYVRPGGKLAVISFHSLEDGIVKKHLRDAAAAGTAALLTRKPLVPDAEEVRRNPRSRSAKLRVATRT